VVSAAIGRFLHARNPGPIIGGGLILIGLGGLLGAVFVHGSASWPALVPGYLVIGMGVGLATPTMSSAGMAAVPVQRGGMAAGALNTARQLGYAFGIALLGSVFAARAQDTFARHHSPSPASLAHAVAGGQAPVLLARAGTTARAALNPVIHEASISGLRGAFLVAAAVGIAAGLAVLALVRPSPPSAWQGAGASGPPSATPADRATG
jgi:hypothetical protein